MDESLQEARNRRDRLRDELAMIEQYIELHTRIFGDAEANKNRSNETTTVVHSNDGGSDERGDDAPLRRRNNPKRIADVSFRILNAATHPMPRGKLLAALRDEGITIHSGDPSKYLGTILWRNSDRFVNIEGAGYWPAGRDVPRDESHSDALFG